MPRAFTLILVVWAALIVLPPIPARADAIANHEARQARFHQGIAALEAEQWQRAHEIYRELWAESQTYDIAISLAQAELNLKRYRDAAEHLEYGIRNIAAREKPEFTKRARRWLRAAKKHVATLHIEAAPAGAEITVDQEIVGKAPLEHPVFVDPGTHSVRATSEGHRPAQRAIDGAAGEELTISLELDPVPSSGLGAPSSEGGGGAPTGADKAVFSSSASEAPGEDEAGPARDRARAEKPEWPYWAAGGVTVVGLGLGVGFTITTRSEERRLKDLQRSLRDTGWENPCSAEQFSAECSRLDSAIEDHNQQKTGAAVGWAALGVGLGGLLGYWLVPEKTFMRAEVRLDRHHAFMSWSGKF